MDGWLTTKQAAERLGMLRTSVVHAITNGGLEAERLGHHYVLRVEVVEAYKTRGKGRGKGAGDAA